MQELIFILFFASLLIALFIRPAWLSGLVSFIGLMILLGVALISFLNSDKHDLTPLLLLEGAWVWGMAVASLLRSILVGPAQVTFQSPYHLTWFYWLLSAFFLAFAAGAIGYAFASNIAIRYAENIEASWVLYDRSMAGAAGGFLFLSFAASNALTALFFKPALTKKGLRAGAAAVVEWNEIDSFEWQGNKLILYRKNYLFRRSSSDSMYVIGPAEQETARRILAQYLPGKQIQSSPPAQATA